MVSTNASETIRHVDPDGAGAQCPAKMPARYVDAERVFFVAVCCTHHCAVFCAVGFMSILQ